MSAIASAKKFAPEDVVVGLFALRSGDKPRFPADAVNIQKAVAGLRSNATFEPLFDDFAFDTRDYFPYSDYLEEVIDGLQLSGYLERTNPRGAYYSTRPALKRLFESSIQEKFTKEELERLRQASEEFFKVVDC